MALSPDGRYLVVGHYNNAAAPRRCDCDSAINAITIQPGKQHQTDPWAILRWIAFGASDGLALIVTASTDSTTDSGAFFLLDPATGTLRLLETLATLQDFPWRLELSAANHDRIARHLR
jgi:hypothetical protein